MKHLILLVLALFFSSIAFETKAQNSFLDHYCTYSEFSSATTNPFDKKDGDYSLLQYTIAAGYRTDFGLSFYIPCDLSTLLYNPNTTKNYDIQTCLGLGIGYAFGNGKEGQEWEILGICSSTILNEDVDYLYPKLMARWGYRVRNLAPYISFGVSYLSPYTSWFKDKFMFGVSLGLKIL